MLSERTDAGGVRVVGRSLVFVLEEKRKAEVEVKTEEGVAWGHEAGASRGCCCAICPGLALVCRGASCARGGFALAPYPLRVAHCSHAALPASILTPF